MSETKKIRIVVDEEPEIVARLDALGNAEGLSRSDMLRRAIRRLVFSVPSVPVVENIPQKEAA